MVIGSKLQSQIKIILPNNNFLNSISYKIYPIKSWISINILAAKVYKI